MTFRMWPVMDEGTAARGSGQRRQGGFGGEQARTLQGVEIEVAGSLGSSVDDPVDADLLFRCAILKKKKKKL